MLELPREDVPPERIWHHEERLGEWFEAVKQNRTARMRGGEAVPDADDGDSVGNELAKGLRD